MPAVIACGYYFEKRRALATGISVCGSGKVKLGYGYKSVLATAISVCGSGKVKLGYGYKSVLATAISVCGSGKLRLRKVRLVSVTFGWVVLDWLDRVKQIFKKLVNKNVIKPVEILPIKH